jgi:alkanesulfonate monooxygenase SsuD/methylene tetrahydromethanopterin reductase-like flavin-dependent oxidoreductase (luciferase family)
MGARTNDPDTRIRIGLSVPNMAEPAELVELGIRTEANGWDGFFLWDHVHGSPEAPFPIADAWVVLGALATMTDRVRLGTTITPLARRRPQEVARQTVTLDRLSGGRAVLGVGLGEPPEEFTAYGDSDDPRERAAILDEALDVIAGLWSGEPFDHDGEHFTVRGAQYTPTSVQQPRVPVWTACVVPHRRPLERAARWDGVVLANLGEGGSIDPVTPEHVQLAAKEIGEHRDSLAGYDLVATLPGVPEQAERDALADAGASWILVTGWMEQLQELVDMAGSAPR